MPPERCWWLTLNPSKRFWSFLLFFCFRLKIAGRMKKAEKLKKISTLFYIISPKLYLKSCDLITGINLFPSHRGSLKSWRFIYICIFFVALASTLLLFVVVVFFPSVWNVAELVWPADFPSLDIIRFWRKKKSACIQKVDWNGCLVM